MWNRILTLSDDKKDVIAKMPKDIPVDTKLEKQGIDVVLTELGAADYWLVPDSIDLFIKLEGQGKKDAYQGICIAKRKNAEIDFQLEHDDMQASLITKGAYGGRKIKGSDIMYTLAKGHILKGIDKTALKKFLHASASLAPGESFSLVVAQGKPAINGSDAYCKPLIEDANSRVLVPQQKEGSEKLDMKDLGKTVSVTAGDAVMQKIHATEGQAGFTVTGQILEPAPGKDIELKQGKNTVFSEANADILISTISGLPIIKNNSVDIDNAMMLKSVGVETGHVKFKGNLVITENIEPGMVVRATGDIIVGGFIESADVQAQGDITVTKGIIGRTVTDDEALTCIVKSGKSITANYAQYALLQAHDDIKLKVHSMSNQIMCGHDLTVLEDNEKGGTLSGRTAKIGGKVTCFNLGVEGDTPTLLHVFAKYDAMKEKLNALKDDYDAKQTKTMNIVRKELEYKKTKPSERSEEQGEQIARDKELFNKEMMEVKETLDRASERLEQCLQRNVVDVKGHLYTHVTVKFGGEKILTKKEHGPTLFSFNQHEIKADAKMDSDDIQTSE